MSTGDPRDYSSLATDNTAGTITAGSYYYDESSPNIEQWRYVNVPSVWYAPIKNKKGDDDMRYLYYVILVNPKTDEFFTTKVVAKSETSALMAAYNLSQFSEPNENETPFDDLKYNCKQLMEWKKEKSLEKALETIKKAVE